MPTKENTKSDRGTRLTLTLEHSAINEGRNLIRQMFEYENAAREQGINLSAKNKMILAQREFMQAELVADLIRLTACGSGESASCSAALVNFCTKICDLALPSNELLGTYLAAVDLANSEDSLREVSSPVDEIRATMICVLRTCVGMMKKKTMPLEHAAA